MNVELQYIFAGNLVVLFLVIGIVQGDYGSDDDNGDVGIQRDLARGWGDDISWFTLDAGLATAKERNTPLMVIIHKSWCGACKALKPQFAGDETIQNDLAKSFIMVNVGDDDEPSDSQFTPDGGYIPRILFLYPNGKVESDLINTNGNPSYKYFYSDNFQVVESMRRAITHFQSTSDSGNGQGQEHTEL